MTDEGFTGLNFKPNTSAMTSAGVHHPCAPNPGSWSATTPTLRRLSENGFEKSSLKCFNSDRPDLNQLNDRFFKLSQKQTVDLCTTMRLHSALVDIALVGNFIGTGIRWHR